MAKESIHVEEEALTDLRDALAKSGEDYKSNLARLTALIEEITSGDIQGDPATDLLNKYNDKKESLNKLAETVDEAQEYMGIKTTKFGSMIGDLSSGMK